MTGIPARRHGRKLGAAIRRFPRRTTAADPLAGLSLADLLTKKRDRIV